MDEEAAQFHAEEFLGEGLVGQVAKDLIAILDAIGPGARGQDKFDRSSRRRGARNGREQSCRAKIVLALLLWRSCAILEGPNTDEVRDR